MEVIIGLVSFVAGGIVATLYHTQIALAEQKVQARLHPTPPPSPQTPPAQPPGA